MYFVIRKSANKQYYFIIKADNHQVVATSETYTVKSSAERTIQSIKNGVNSNSSVLDMTEE